MENQILTMKNKKTEKFQGEHTDKSVGRTILLEAHKMVVIADVLTIWSNNSSSFR